MKQFRDERGQTTIMMALFMGTFLLGFVALGIDVQNLFRAKRMAQAAADAAALAAAEEYTAKAGDTAAHNAAYAMAKMNGFDNSLATNPASVTFPAVTAGNSDGSTSSYVVGSYVQVVVSKPIPTFFMGLINHKSTVTVSATAVAGGGLSSPTCVCLEGTTGMDLNMSNNAQLSATGCGVTINSNSSNAAQIVGSASVNAISLGSVSLNWYPSGVNNGGSVSTTKVVQGITNKCGPSLPPVPSYDPALCTADPLTNFGNGGSSYSVGPSSTYSTTQGGNLVCYNSLTVGSNADRVNLNPGIYVINGGQLHFLSGANNASNTGGVDVFFYLTGNASLVIDNGANVTLKAPTSGPYTGTILFQDSADTQDLSIQGGSNTTFNGTIYATAANVKLGNGSGTTLNADIVAKTLTMNGGGTLTGSATSNLGNFNLSTAKVTE